MVFLSFENRILNRARSASFCVLTKWDERFARDASLGDGYFVCVLRRVVGLVFGASERVQSWITALALVERATDFGVVGSGVGVCAPFAASCGGYA